MESNQVELYRGLYFTIPKRKIAKDKILNARKKPFLQKWNRVNFDEDDFNELDIEEQIKFADEEDRRCEEGFWFWNNGELIYITGDHYHYLTWFKLDSGYPDYRDADRRWFYHWQLCDLDDECLGQMYGKKRRDGYSYRVDSIILNRARREINSNYGMISKTGDDAKEMFQKLVHAFLEYPEFLKPQVKSAEDVIRELIFRTPQKRVTFKNRREKTKKEFSLNNKIDWKSSKQNAYDGMKLKILACDEAGKFQKEVNLEKWFNIGSTCLILGGVIIGKMMLGSTVNELDQGGEAFLALWGNSDETERTENGRTTTGLWRYFVPAYDGAEGFIDEYGNSVIETPKKPIMGIHGKMIKKGARPWLEAELKAKEKARDMVGYYERKRQFPMVEEDMFITPANERTCWDIAKIHQQIEHNKIYSVEQNELVYGYFQWVNGERDTEVEWVPLPYGNPRIRHAFAWLPEARDRNRQTWKNGKKAPANEHKGLFTLDPYSAVNTVDKRQSKAASHGFKKFDTMDPKYSDVFIGEYWNRLSDPLLVYEDMIMQCVYFGWPLMPERNIRNCNDYFRNRDYHNYMLPPPKMTKEDYIKSLGKEEDAGLANTAGQTQQQLIEYLANYISHNVGVNEETGEMGFMPFTNTLKDWLEFDVIKWTPYDLTVSAMVSVIGSRTYSPIQKPKRRVYNLFKKYDNSGIESVEIEDDTEPSSGPQRHEAMPGMIVNGRLINPPR